MRLITLLLVVATVAAGCAPNSTTVDPESSQSAAIQDPANIKCNELINDVSGLEEWIAAVRVSGAYAKELGFSLPSEVFDRADGYQAFELSLAFGDWAAENTIRARAIEVREQVRELGPGCIQRFDAILQLADNIAVLAAAVISCTLSSDKVYAASFACGDSEFEGWRRQLISSRLEIIDQPIEGPSPEYVAGYRQWSEVANPGLESLSAFDVCLASSGYLYAPVAGLVNRLAVEDYLLQSEPLSPLLSRSEFEFSPVRLLWDASSPDKAMDGAVVMFGNFLNTAARRKRPSVTKLVNALRNSNPNVESRCIQPSNSMEALIGSLAVKVPAKSYGLGSLGDAAEAAASCSKDSFRKKMATELGNPLIEDYSFCFGRLWYGQFPVIIGQYVQVHSDLAAQSNFTKLFETIE